jgi:hypothetical protein
MWLLGVMWEGAKRVGKIPEAAWNALRSFVRLIYTIIPATSRLFQEATARLLIHAPHVNRSQAIEHSLRLGSLPGRARCTIQRTLYAASSPIARDRRGPDHLAGGGGQ